ncbi:MAG: hypothetical protein BAJALOKI3v1_860017 [Promethearchaeota archaeon]|nr:MAG: hypothetical protein BAJALOKI3v1_860017 [Candidatus Lokiarchaeota archaeon]
MVNDYKEYKYNKNISFMVSEKQKFNKTNKKLKYDI